MIKRNLLKKGLIISAVFLLVISSIVPMTIGNNTKKLEQDNFLEKLVFICTDAMGFSESKFEHYKEYRLVDYPNKELTIGSNSKKLTNTSNPSSKLVSCGPMDSPWPMSCHDLRHTSKSPYSTTNTPGTEKWNFKCDWMESGPVIGNDGIIYFGDFDNYLYALYPDGTMKWRYRTDNWIWSTPAIAEDGSIHVGCWDGKLYAINPNGTLKWRFSSGGSIASSPAIADDGTIYFGTMSSGNSIYAVNPNGTEKWHYTTGYSITSSPAIGNDGTIYIGSGDTFFYAMNPNGTLQWRFKTGDYIKGPPSIAEDGTIYIGSYDGYLYALYPNGTKKWQCGIGDGSETNPSIGSDGTIYIGGNYLYAINPNGTLKWKFGSSGFIHQSSPAISADGTIYFGTDDTGMIYAVNPDGTEKWQKKIANKWVESSPSIASDGTVYIGSTYDMGGGYLHAFGIGEFEADASGPYYGLINEPVQFTGSARNGTEPYSWHWNFGDGQTSEEKNPMHTYTNANEYTVTLTVIDYEGKTANDNALAKIKESNTPPNKPSITGPADGNTGTSYDYTFVATDQDNDEWLNYYIDWGDSSNSGWLGPYVPGEVITVSHTWTEQGTYIIKAKAKDNYGGESDWGTLSVTMPLDLQIIQSNNLQISQHSSNQFLLKILGQFMNRSTLLERLLNSQ